MRNKIFTKIYGESHCSVTYMSSVALFILGVVMAVIRKILFLIFLSTNAWAYTSYTVTVTWDHPLTNESGFQVERSTDGVNFVKVATVASDQKLYVDPSTEYDTMYWYRVAAISSQGLTAYAVTPPKRTPPPPTAPGEVENFIITAEE